ncbi:Flippase-like domain-containing protein [Azospirillaceae bacterium]
MRWRTLACTVGLGGLVALVILNGAAEVAALLLAAGWGVGAVCAFHLLPMLANALAWSGLLSGREQTQPVHRLWGLRWLADSINALLPVAQIGGEVVRGQWLIRRGADGAVTAAAIIVDLTIGLVTLVLFILVGIGLALARDAAAPIVPVLAGTALFTLLLGIFYRLQRSALPLRLAHFMEHQVGGSAWNRLAGGSVALNVELERLYRHPGRLTRCTLWRLVGWVGGAVELWLILAILGHPIGPIEVLIVEAVGQSFRNAGFAIPGALGVQEGGLIVAGGLVQLGPEVALAVSLVKRVRDLLLGIPALLAWQFIEGRSRWYIIKDSGR